MRQSEESRKKRMPLLGVAAYVLVPGERRNRAGGHFRRAGFELLQGTGALLRPEKPPDPSESRQRIEID
jgi:hypothetical protein